MALLQIIPTESGNYSYINMGRNWVPRLRHPRPRSEMGEPAGQHARCYPDSMRDRTVGGNDLLVGLRQPGPDHAERGEHRARVQGAGPGNAATETPQRGCTALPAITFRAST